VNICDQKTIGLPQSKVGGAKLAHLKDETEFWEGETS